MKGEISHQPIECVGVHHISKTAFETPRIHVGRVFAGSIYQGNKTHELREVSMKRCRVFRSSGLSNLQ